MIATVKQLEQDLLIEALEVARIGLCVFDANGQIVMVNRDFAEKLNLDPERLINQTVAALSAHDLVINNLRELVAINSEEIATEGRFQSKHGQLSILLFQARTLDRGQAGKYRVVSMVDITNFGITRDRYIELRRQLDALNCSVILVDVSQESMPIIYVNKRFEEMTGYSAPDVIGKNCRFLQRDNNEQPGVAKLRGAINNRQSCHTVIENYKKDGTKFLNELFISPVYDRAGNANIYVGIQQEINGRVAPYQSNK